MKNMFVKSIIVVCCAIFSSVMSMADEATTAKKPLKVLMIGNSFSICVLRDMPALAKEMGLPLDIVSLYIGGCTLDRHWANCEKPESKPYWVTWSYTSCEHTKVPFANVLELNKNKKEGKGNIPAMLAADKWDIVTVQQGSHSSWQAKTYEPFGSNLIAKIKELAPQAKIYVQQTWSYTPWDGRLKKWGIDQNQMFDNLKAAYGEFATKHGFDQILMGQAVQNYRKELPVVYTEKSNDDDVCGTRTFVEKDGKWRPEGDVFHLNKQGEFLQALVWTAKLFNVDVTKSNYLPKSMEKQPDRAKLMRKIATELK